MASKYDELRILMGGVESYNDKTTHGRVLKWYGDTVRADKKTCEMIAGEVLQKLIDAGCYYVQRVEVKPDNWTKLIGKQTFTNPFYDKICVFIDPI